MKYKKSIIIICLAICVLFSISSVCAGDLNNTAVAGDDTNQAIEGINDESVFSQGEGEFISSENENVVGTGEAGTFSELQALINDTASGSTITLDKDYNYNSGFDTEGIRIQKDLTINGNGHTLNGLSKSRIFYMGFEGSSAARYTVILNNINFKNGRGDDGGAIQTVSSTYWPSVQYSIDQYYILKVNKCSFTGNVATCNGGAISSRGELTLTNSVFKNNVASKDGGGVDSSISQIFKCTFAGNSARDGGAIKILGDYNYPDKDSKVNYCTFNLNKASGDGGAVYVDTPDVVIANSKFARNSAKGEGGAIYAWGVDEMGGKNGAYLNVLKCTFSGNSAKNGGAIRLFDESKVTYSTFTGNSAKNGGAIYVYGGISQIARCTFNSNKASYNGGAIYITKDRCYILYSKFIGNYAKYKGGAIYNDYSKKSGALKCVFCSNKAGSYKDLYGVGAAKCVFLKLTLILKPAVVKKSATRLYLSATLKSGNEPLKLKWVLFNFNGKNYKARTNKYGIAKVTIPKSILNKLKVGQSVVYQVHYSVLTPKRVAKVLR